MNSKTHPTAPWARACYGLDVAPDGVRVVLATRCGRQIVFENREFDSDRIKQDAECGFAVAASMPVMFGITTWISAPFSSIAKATRVFPTLLDIKLPFALDDCIYDFTETEKSDEGISTLALAARKRDIKARLKELNEIGVDPHVLDYEGLALWTQLLREQASSKTKADSSLKILFFVRHNQGVLVIGRGSRFRSCHRINLSTPASIDRYLLAQFNILDIDDPKNDETISWIWAGSGFADGDPGARLQEHIQQRWNGSNTMLDAPDYFLARALATRALLLGPMRTNLRHAEFLHAVSAKYAKKETTKSTIMVFIAGIILLASTLTWNFHISSLRKNADRNAATVLNRMLGYKIKAHGAQALIIAQRELEARKVAMQPILSIFEPSLLAKQQHILKMAEKYKIEISHLHLSLDILEIEGSTPAKAQLQAFVSALNSGGNKVVISDEHELKSSRLGFVLKGKANE